MRTLLVPLTDHKGQDGVMTLAFAVSRLFSSHLTCLFIRPDPRAAIPFMGEGLTADTIQDLVDASDREGKARATRTLAMFEAVQAREKIAMGDGLGGGSEPTVSWEETTGFIADRVGRAARLADLTLVPQPVEPNTKDAAEILNEVMFRSGRPLMLAPPAPSTTLTDTILVAWNGRAECARTVANALPFLRRAKRVLLLTIDDEHPDRPSLKGLQLYLARNKIKAEIVQRDSGDDSVGVALVKAASDKGVNMLVMGAYSHSRWREMIIGGVTRHAIYNMPVPVFMSH